MLLDRAVASPITDETGKSIGVLYGDRALGGASAGQPIGELEAALLEVLAGAVSSGLARQREEQRRASLTQFFSPRIAELLESQQNLLGVMMPKSPCCSATFVVSAVWLSELVLSEPSSGSMMF